MKSCPNINFNRIECAIIECLIATRLGAEFFVQFMSVTLTGDITGETGITRGFRQILIIGTVVATYIVLRRKTYVLLKKQHLYYLFFLLLYVAVMYYYLFIDDLRTYYGLEAKAILNRTMNNVLFLFIASMAFLSDRINSHRICKYIVILSFITSWMYMSFFGVDFGEKYDGFMLQASGFSSLQVGYFSGMNFLFSLYLYNNWSSTKLVNIVVTIILCATFLYMIVASGKTGPTIFTFFIALLACKQMFLPNIKVKSLVILFILIALVCILFFDAILSVIDSFNPNLATKISNTFLKGDTSDRDSLFQEAIRVFSDNILFGSYFELKKYNIYPHNFFLENLITWGICGTLIMVAFLWKAFKTSVHLIMHNSRLVWVVYLLSFAFLSAQSTGSLYGNYRFWLGLTIIITISNAKNRKSLG